MSRKKSTIDQLKLKKFGERLKSLRLYLKMSQRNFAKTIGISGNYVSYLENGKSAPSKPVLLAIKDQYLITPEQILTGNGFCLNKVKKYPLIKEKIGPSTVHEYMEEISTTPNPVDQITGGIKQLFTKYEKELEEILNICKDLQERVSSLEEQDKKRIPGAGSAGAGSGSHAHTGVATRKKER